MPLLLNNILICLALIAFFEPILSRLFSLPINHWLIVNYGFWGLLAKNLISSALFFYGPYARYASTRNAYLNTASSPQLRFFDRSLLAQQRFLRMCGAWVNVDSSQNFGTN